ncbi:MAG: flagellar basal body L-ring protein FlgH [bacterium]
MNKVTSIAFAFLAISLIFQCDAACGKSLWDPAASVNKLYTAGNASNVGDILTIIITENNRATEVADAEAKRKSTMSGKIGAFFKENIAGKLFGHKKDKSIDYPEFIFDGQNDFKGETEVERSDTFSARVAAKIVMVDDNGNFLIEARKTINIGKETKSIVLSGSVRPNDITAENTVQSTQIADAQISYEGGGPITGMANPGVFTKLLSFFF